MAVLNKYRDRVLADAVDIMRPNRLGNPFVVGCDGDRATVIRKYESWFFYQCMKGHITEEWLASLHGRDLVCCCKPRACHGDVVERAIRWAWAMCGPRTGRGRTT